MRNGDHEEKVKQANELYEKFQKNGVSCIFDDRENVTIGTKIKDAKVLGTPYILVLGDKNDGEQLEIENIKTGKKLPLSL